MSEMIGSESKTSRGFGLVEFVDNYNYKCSVQVSSAAVFENEDGTVNDPLGWIWLGVDDTQPKIMKFDAKRLGLPLPAGEVSGWMPYELPEEVLVSSRMHLNEEQVRGLVARLNHWLETGRLTTEDEATANYT